MSVKRNSEREAKRAEAKLRRALIDEYGDLVRALAPHKADLARLTKLASTIREWYKDADERTSFLAEGDHFSVTVGPCGNQTKIVDMDGVYDALGHDPFIAACSMSLANLKAALAGRAVEGAFTEVEMSGSRDLTLTELPQE